jgi:myo-inositol 2-dehydrogenase/D-chiro-inositol 1-dehydrogenase
VAGPRPAIAVFGAGRIGRVHAATVARMGKASLAGVADIDFDAAQRVISSLGRGRVDTTEAFLDDPRVAAVIIATPTETHVDLIVRAAAAKKHVFCEKPISLEIGTTIHAIQACADAGIILQIGFQRRFDRDFVSARDAIASGRLGDVRYLRLVQRDHAMPPISYIRTSGGQYKDQMVHDFDAARWLLAPAQVEEVVATGSALIDPAVADAGDVDTSVACLRFSNGAIAVVEASREAVYGYDSRAEIHGSRGLLLNGYRGLTPGRVIDGSRVTPANDSFIGRFSKAYRVEILDFVDAIAENRRPLVDGYDALAALRIAVAADRSRSERRAVALAEIEGM